MPPSLASWSRTNRPILLICSLISVSTTFSSLIDQGFIICTLGYPAEVTIPCNSSYYLTLLLLLLVSIIIVVVVSKTFLLPYMQDCTICFNNLHEKSSYGQSNPSTSASDASSVVYFKKCHHHFHLDCLKAMYEAGIKVPTENLALYGNVEKCFDVHIFSSVIDVMYYVQDRIIISTLKITSL